MDDEKRVAIFIINYNMPERADALASHIIRYVRWPYKLFLIDNGSDLVLPAVNTNVHIDRNIQTTKGWRYGLQLVRESGDFLAYWFLITSAEFVAPVDILSPMANYLLEEERAVGIHPSLTSDSTSDWPHLFNRFGFGIRETWHIDNIASLWRADWFNQVGGFDARMTMAWGIDLDLSYKARQDSRGLFVHEGVEIKKVTDIGYQMDRMNMSADERRQLASAEMAEILADKYGPDCWQRVTGDYITEDMLMPGVYRDLERVSCHF